MKILLLKNLETSIDFFLYDSKQEEILIKGSGSLELNSIIEKIVSKIGDVIKDVSYIDAFCHVMTNRSELFDNATMIDQKMLETLAAHKDTPAIKTIFDAKELSPYVPVAVIEASDDDIALAKQVTKNIDAYRTLYFMCGADL